MNADNVVPDPQSLQPMMPANDLLNAPPQALRDQLAEEGYLLFRQIMPVEKILALREQITEILAEVGWIRGGVERPDAQAIGLPWREGEPGYFEALDRIMALEALYALAHDNKLISVLRLVIGETVFPHPLSIMRLVFPNNPEITTPPHQDYPNNQGTKHLTAAWIPLGNCSVEQGSLAILKGSHKGGVLPLQFHLGTGNRAAVVPDMLKDLPWVTTDFGAGDVLLFPSLTVHAALENKDPCRMRLSVDYRYQREGEALTPVCLEPHFGRLTWDEIYRSWKSDRYKYYWKDKSFEIVPWDGSLQALPADHIKEAVKKSRHYDMARKQRHLEKIGTRPWKSE